MTPKDYDLVLLQPIREAKTMRKVRARARAARMKLHRHELATGMYIGDAVDWYDRVTETEQDAARVVVYAEQHNHAPFTNKENK